MLGSKFANKSTAGIAAGQTMAGKTIAKAVGGYIVEVASLPQRRGFMADAGSLRIGAEILVRVIGQKDGVPLLQPVFATYR